MLASCTKGGVERFEDWRVESGRGGLGTGCCVLIVGIDEELALCGDGKEGRIGSLTPGFSCFVFLIGLLPLSSEGWPSGRCLSSGRKLRSCGSGVDMDPEWLGRRCCTLASCSFPGEMLERIPWSTWLPGRRLGVLRIELYPAGVPIRPLSSLRYPGVVILPQPSPVLSESLLSRLPFISEFVLLFCIGCKLSPLERSLGTFSIVDTANPFWDCGLETSGVVVFVNSQRMDSLLESVANID